jgi:glycosyltransferase involved in cell wall biosynthesis
VSDLIDAPATDPRRDDRATRRAPGRALSLAFYMPSLAGGGAERMTLTLIGALIARGARTTLLLSNAVGPLADDVPPACDIVDFGTRRTAFDLPRLRRFLRDRRPDVLLTSMNHNNVVAMIAKPLARSGTRLVIMLHNALSAEAGAGASLGYRVLPYFYRALAPAADGIVAVSRGVADDAAAAAGISRGSISVLHNPIIDPGFSTRAAAPADHPWLQEPGVPVFVTAGRLVPQKDHAVLLHAMAIRLRRGPARLIVLGDGPERATLERLADTLGIGAHVAFPGFVANPLPYFRAAAAFVLSSRFEGFGNVLVEALGCGTPVISTDCTYGPSEILEDGAWGVLTPVGDAGAMASAMATDLRARWPAAALRARAATFGVDRVADDYLAFLTRVLAGAGRDAAAEEPR